MKTTPRIPAAPTRTPAHLRPENCFVCGGAEHEDTTDTGGHRFWSNAAAEAEAREADRRTTARYSNGETTPEGAYVAEHRPY